MEFLDEWGLHKHETSVPGRPYDPTKKITCGPCKDRLNTVMNDWLDQLTKRENLPEGFWNGYKFPWSD